MSSITYKRYDEELEEATFAYAEAVSHLADKPLSSPGSDYAVRVWESAQRICNSQSAWGGSVPGVSLDCAGSVMATVVGSGLFKAQKVGKDAHGARYRDSEDSSLVLHKRMMAHMMLFCAFNTIPEALAIPVVNPENLYAGDIFVPPYIAVINGVHLPPHAAIFAAKDMVLSTNPASGKVELYDIRSFPTLMSPDALCTAKYHSLVWRCIPAALKDQTIVYHEARCVKRAYEMIEESRKHKL